MTRCTPIPFTSTPTGDQPWWVNPGAILSVSSFRVTTVTFAFGVKRSIAPADPKRVAIGIAVGSTPVTGLAIGPLADPATGGFGLNTTTTSLWFSIFTHGPMVCADWIGVASGTPTIAVYEWYRLP